MSESPGRAFWLCHECGAQMRPIRIDGVRQCASCNSEFIEILDPEVNPDPIHELPPAPPVRPQTSPPIPGNRPSSPPANPAPSITDILGGMFTGVFGGGGGDEQPHPHANQQDQQAAPDNSPFGRTFQFNIGGGSGSVTFGTIGGGGGGGFQPFGPGPGQGPRGGRTVGGFGPFGPVPGSAPEHGGDQGGGLDAFFPGFPPAPPGHGQQGQGRGRTTGGPQGPAVVMQGGDLFRVLMNVLGDEGIPGVANVGDYATSEQGFAQILEQLMQAAGPQGPLPATDAVIEGLPRVKLDEDAIEKSSFKDCPVCKDDFAPGDEIMRVPCQHIFHVDCLQPWLKTNGSCPVCRFSLVPDESNQARPNQTQTPAEQTTGTSPAPRTDSPVTGPSGITNILHRLWGQSGSPSQPSSPTTENPPQTPPTGGQAGSSSTRNHEPTATPPPGSTSESEEAFYTPPTTLPPGLEQPTPDQAEVGMSEADRHARARERMNRDFHLSPHSLVERGFNPSPQELRDAEIRRNEEEARYAAQARARNEQRLRNEAMGLYGTAEGSQPRAGQASGQVEAEERLPTSIPEDYRERHRQKELEESRQRERQSQQRDNDPYLDDLD